MNVTVLTPRQEVFQGEALTVKVPGTSGIFEILKGHAPIVSSLQKGTVSIKTIGGEVVKFEIQRGFVEVLNNEVSILVNETETTAGIQK